ncbi:MAG: phosphoglucosamine mutase [Halobacteriaceae archaeon]
MEVFGSSGARGIVGESVGPTFVCDVARAAGTVWDAERVAVARDTRRTGRLLANAAVAGLQSVGLDVVRLGILPTPGLQAYCEAEGLPGLMITASHNPPQYNGVKLVDSDGVEPPLDRLDAIETTFLEGTMSDATWNQTGEDRSDEQAKDRYVKEIVDAVDQERITEADLTVAIDPAHGAGALTSPEIFRQLGCRVLTVNAQPDGHFPGRDPEPIQENLADLARLTRTSEADIGIAHDGDADRAIMIDETGEYVEGDATLAALAAAELEAGDTAVAAVNVSQRLVDVVEAEGAKLELTPIGSTHIMNRIRALRAADERVPIAGEGNGGIVFPAYRLARDGAYTAARFLELLADQQASAVLEPYDGYENVRVNVGYGDEGERDALMEAAAREAEAAEAEVTTTDGYRLDYGDAWVLARPSGTEPLVRIYAEAKDEQRARTLAESMEQALRTARDER